MSALGHPGGGARHPRAGQRLLDRRLHRPDRTGGRRRRGRHGRRGAPYPHAIDATSGDLLWQQDVAGPTYAAAAEANGVVFIGGTDFTFRALDLRGGDVLWSAS